MRFIACALIGMMLAAAVPASAAPFHMRNHSPVWFGLLYPVADRAVPLPEGETGFRGDLYYSNIFFRDIDAGWSYFFDMELAQFSFEVRRGFAGFEAGADMPVYRGSGGFLDEMTAQYHRAFGFPMYFGQERAEMNRYYYRVNHGGNVWNSVSANDAQFGDPTIWIKTVIFSGEEGDTAIKFLLQPPLAPTSGGFGNGAPEGGLMLIAGRHAGPVDITLNTGLIHHNFIDRGDKVGLRPSFYLDLAGEYPFTGAFSGVAQLSYASPPYGNGASEMYRWSWEAFTFGARWLSASGREWELSFTEDLSYTAPDFTIHLGAAF